MHKRTELRNRLETILTGLTTTGSNVFASRVAELSSAEVPGLKLYIRDEQVDDEASFAYGGIVECDVMIECYVKVNSTFDSQLDLILEEVQAAIDTDRLVGLRSIVKSIKYAGLGVEYEEGEKDIGRQVITYKAEYEQKL